jgi:predicted secreted hydrolase
MRRPVVLVAASIALLSLATGGPAQQVWKQVLRGYPLSVPRDHVSHPAYKIEWWYYTGNVDTDRGRRFGYQVTFFRIGVNAAPSNPSRFAVRDIFIAHVAVTDAVAGRHLFAERVSRAGVGAAGATTFDYRVWNGDWEARLEYGRHRIQARDRRFSLDLTLFEDKPVVLNGDHGYSQKGAAEGNATEYYSLTRMTTEGAISVDGERYQVRGNSWMDHEFGTTFLESNQRGWDWLSLQLEDGSDLMAFRLRRADGSVDPQSSGTLVAKGAPSRRLGPGDFTLTPGRAWTSPASGGVYPVEWQVKVPSDALDVTVTPVIDAQELVGTTTGVKYWEGAVDVKGTRGAQPVAGRGYLEMTGYAGASMGEMLRD